MMEGPHIKELLNYWSRKFYHEGWFLIKKFYLENIMYYELVMMKDNFWPISKLEYIFLST